MLATHYLHHWASTFNLYLQLHVWVNCLWVYNWESSPLFIAWWSYNVNAMLHCTMYTLFYIGDNLCCTRVWSISWSCYSRWWMLSSVWYVSRLTWYVTICITMFRIKFPKSHKAEICQLQSYIAIHPIMKS